MQSRPKLSDLYHTISNKDNPLSTSTNESLFTTIQTQSNNTNKSLRLLEQSQTLENEFALYSNSMRKNRSKNNNTYINMTSQINSNLKFPYKSEQHKIKKTIHKLSEAYLKDVGNKNGFLFNKTIKEKLGIIPKNKVQFHELEEEFKFKKYEEQTFKKSERKNKTQFQIMKMVDEINDKKQQPLFLTPSWCSNRKEEFISKYQGRNLISARPNYTFWNVPQFAPPTRKHLFSNSETYETFKIKKNETNVTYNNLVKMYTGKLNKKKLYSWTSF